MQRLHRVAAVVSVIALVAGACGSASPSASSTAASPVTVSPSVAGPTTAVGSAPAASLDTTPVTLSLWDYYGDSTPITQAVRDAFTARYPWITLDYQALPYDDMQTKYNAAVATGQTPDVGTLDMTWIPTLAANGALADLTPVANGQINGKAFSDLYTPGALEAMTFGDQTVTALFDFDTYALYYRSDLFEAKGIQVPVTWEELRAAAKAIAEDTNGDGKPDHALYAVRPEVFHFSQFLLQAGGSILNADNTKAAFNSDAGVAAIQAQKALIDDGTAIYGPDADQNAIVDGRIAMFQDGPYYMGILKSGAPALAGKWRVAPAPTSNKAGSYLGGTGLSISKTSQHPAAAWLLIQFLLEDPQEIGVFTIAGAAPATTPALQSDALTKPDPYFGGQAPFNIFADSLAISTPFPYVKAWNDIAGAISEAVESALLTGTDPKQALDAAAVTVDALLSK